MFKIGKKYEIKMLIGGEEETFWRTVEKYDYPIVKFSDHTIDEDDIFAVANPKNIGKVIYGEIVNITSPSFVRAVEESEKIEPAFVELPDWAKD